MNSSFAAAENAPAGHPAATSIWRPIMSAAGSFIRHIVLAFARQRTMRILDGLDDASLKDIGLSRSDIDGIDRHDRYLPHFARY